MPYPLPQTIHQVLAPDGTLVGEPPELSAEQLVGYYRWMLLGRTLSDRMVAMQRQGRMGTFAPINGQEASLVGLAAPLQAEDWLAGSYREILAYMMKGITPLQIMRYYRGQLLPNFPHENRCLPIQIVLATQMLHAVGLAMAIKYDGKPHVAVGVCGDGATSEGDFNEALNFAGVYQVPMIFVVQNNGWAISVPRSAQTGAEYIAHRAPGFGMPGVIVDGNDLFAVYQVMREAVDRARSGGGPTLIETITYRLRAHTTADDPTKYRPDEELAKWLPRDPLLRYRAYLQSQNLLTPTQDEQMKQDVQAEVQANVEAFEAQEPPDPLALFDNVFETPTFPQQQQQAALAQELATGGA